MNENTSAGTVIPVKENVFDVIPSELFCKCGCSFKKPDPLLVERINKLSKLLQERVIINSGCRCQGHNAHVGGRPKSLHLTGEAVDLKSRKFDALSVAIVAIRAGFTGVIVHKTFVHLDVRKKAYLEMNAHLFDEEDLKAVVNGKE